MAIPVLLAYFLTLSLSTSTNIPDPPDNEAVPRRTSRPNVVIGRAVPLLLRRCNASRTLPVPLSGRELEGLANPVTGLPDWDTGRTTGS